MKRRSSFLVQASVLFMTLTFIFLLLSCSWDPDRNNPADPGSDLYRGQGSARLQVKTYGNEPISSATIYIVENSTIAMTNDLGEAIVQALVGWIHYRIEKTGYLTVADSIYIYFGVQVQKQVYLDGLPQIDSMKVVAGYDEFDPNGHPDDFNYLYEVTAWVNDPDGIYDLTEISYYDSILNETKDLERVEDGYYSHSLNFGYDNNARNQLLERLGQYIEVTIKDGRGGVATKSGVLANYQRYNHLREDMHLIHPESDYQTPTFELTLASVSFRPLRYRLALVHQNSGSIVLDSLLSYLNYPDQALVRISTNVVLTLNTPYWWTMTLIDPNGNWVKSRLQFQASYQNPSMLEVGMDQNKCDK